MLGLLKNEGWQLKERELAKLRKAHGLLMREPNGRRGTQKRKRDALEELADQNIQQVDDIGDGQEGSREPSPEPTLPPEVIAKRQARQERLLAESEERLKAGTRRRRTKVWAGLPPDPDAPPRYPSELTMEECKRELGLDKSLYAQLRDIFIEICQANNVIKKTLCGGDVWKAIKDELISKMPHLQSIFWGPNASQLNENQQPMALDLVCMDVTKKIRNLGSRVTISDAKNILGVTPQEARDIRAAFDAILKADHFTSKLEVSKEYWDNLKGKWIAESSILQDKLSGGDEDPDLGPKLKSLESIACDVQKRHRDDQTKKDPIRNSRTKPSVGSTANSNTPTKSPSNQHTGSNVANGFGSSSLPSNTTSSVTPSKLARSRRMITNNVPLDGITALASQALRTSYPTFDDYASLQIDPTLLEAAALPPSLQNQQSPSQDTVKSPKPVYFRLSPTSPLKNLSAPKIWLDTLHPPHTVTNLRALALNRSGMQGKAQVTKIEGVAVGEESKWGIDEDDELEAYLEHVGSGKATFVVELV